jgi:hypothetical protein
MDINTDRSFQFEASRRDHIFGITTVTAEAFKEARNWEEVLYCTKCEDPFAPCGDSTGQCYRCRGYNHLAHMDHSDYSF